MIMLFSQNVLDNAKSRDKLTLRCEQCQKSFLQLVKTIREVQRYPLKKNHSCRFCCHKCFNIHQQQHRFVDNNVTCEFCNTPCHKAPHSIKRTKHNFCSHLCSNRFFGKLRTKPRISKPKHEKKIKPIIACLACGKPTENKKYCCGSCRNKINNRNIKGSRSKAEKLLEESLIKNFPKWTILPNDRTILDGLELDIFIPEIKLAIEWNGIFHYEPIRGNECLEKISKRDTLKSSMCKNLGIELIIICDRTSSMKFIQETVNEIIKNLTVIYTSKQAT